MASEQLTCRLFISSTFADFCDERDALQERVFPRFAAACAERNLQFRPIDLRWGVSTDAGHDQQTMKICLEELARCQETGVRPNFLVLLGQRYGWRPLPPTIPVSEFDRIIGCLDPSERDALQTWYRCDDNAVPSEYLLQRRTDVHRTDPDSWTSVEEQLRLTLLKGFEAAFSAPRPNQPRYVASATHQEILMGVLSGRALNQGEVFAYVRTIKGAPPGDAAVQYIDADGFSRSIPDDSVKRLKALRRYLEPKLGPAHYREYDATWGTDAPTPRHLDDFCARVLADLLSVIHRTAPPEPTSWLDRERTAQRLIVAQRANEGADLVEPAAARDEVLGYIAIGGRADSDVPSDSRRKPLLILGPRGVGKTTFVAGLVRNWEKVPHPRERLVYRFLGHTRASTDGEALFESLAAEVAGLKSVVPSLEAPAVASQMSLRNAFDSVPADHPVVLVLDGLDEVDEPATAATLLDLAATTAGHVILIATSRSLVSRFARASSDMDRSRVRTLRFDIFSPTQCESLLDSRLRKNNRRLTATQRSHVVKHFVRRGLRAVHASILCDIACHWKSFDDPASPLGGNLRGAVDRLLEFLETKRHHDRWFVGKALTYLALARHGLSEMELSGVLSADSQLMADFAHHSPTERARAALRKPSLRIPDIYWSRLYADIHPYIVRREEDGHATIAIRDADVRKGILKRYAVAAEQKRVHRALAATFQRLQPQPGVGMAPPQRSASERVFHLLAAGRWRELRNLLSDDAFVQAQTGRAWLLDCLPALLKLLENDRSVRWRFYRDPLPDPTKSCDLLAVGTPGIVMLDFHCLEPNRVTEQLKAAIQFAEIKRHYCEKLLQEINWAWGVSHHPSVRIAVVMLSPRLVLPPLGLMHAIRSVLVQQSPASAVQHPQVTALEPAKLLNFLAGGGPFVKSSDYDSLPPEWVDYYSHVLDTRSRSPASQGNRWREPSWSGR